MKNHRLPHAPSRPRWPSTVVVLLLVLLGAVLCPATLAQAEDEAASVTWGIAPASADGPDGRARFDHLLEPGSTAVDHVHIQNFGTEPLDLTLYAADATTTEEGGFDVATEGDPTHGVGAWVELESTALTVAPRQSVNVAFSIALPANATPGDHVGGIVAVRRSAGAGGTAGLDTEHRVGARIYLRATGTIDTSLGIDDLQARYHGTWNPAARGRATVAFDVENTGNIRVSGPVVVTVEGPFGLGRRTQRAEALDDLLPGHEVHREVTVDGVAPLGPLRVTVRTGDLTSAGQELTGGVGPFASSTPIWAMPYAQALLAGVVAAAVWWRRRVRRRRRAAAAVEPRSSADGGSLRP